MWSRWRQGFTRYAAHLTNIAYFAGTRVISIAAFVVAVPFFIRQTSDEQYGLVAIGFSLLGISMVLDVAFGYVLTQSQGRRIARGRSLDAGKINGLFSVYLGLAIGFSVMGFGCALLAPVSIHEKVFYASLALLLPAMATSGVVAAVFQSQNTLKPVNVSRFSFEIGKAVALVVSAVVDRSILWIGPLLLLVAYTRAASDRLCLKQTTGISLNGVAPRDAIRFWRMARHGSASLFIVLLTVLVTVGDKLLIKCFFNNESVAYYSIAYDVNTKAYLIVNAVNTTMFAVLLHRFARRTSTRAPIMAGLATVSVVAMIFYIPLSLWSEQLLGLWVSPAFAAQSASLASIMSGASLLYLYGNVFENALTAMGRAQDVLSIYVVAICLYGVSLPAMVYLYAISGFMYSYLILCAVFCFGFLYKYYSISKGHVVLQN